MVNENLCVVISTQEITSSIIIEKLAIALSLPETLELFLSETGRFDHGALSYRGFLISFFKVH